MGNLFRGAITLVVLAIIGAIISFFTDAGRNEVGEIDSAGEVGAFELQVGDCLTDINKETFTSVDAVPCAQPHIYEVYSKSNFPSSYTLNSSQTENYMDDHCVDAASTFVGANFNYENISFSLITPTPDSYDSGDREFLCLLTTVDGSSLIGSLQGKGR